MPSLIPWKIYLLWIGGVVAARDPADVWLAPGPQSSVNFLQTSATLRTDLGVQTKRPRNSHISAMLPAKAEDVAFNETELHRRFGVAEIKKLLAAGILKVYVDSNSPDQVGFVMLRSYSREDREENDSMPHKSAERLQPGTVNDMRGKQALKKGSVVVSSAAEGTDRKHMMSVQVRSQVQPKIHAKDDFQPLLSVQLQSQVQPNIHAKDDFKGFLSVQLQSQLERGDAHMENEDLPVVAIQAVNASDAGRRPP